MTLAVEVLWLWYSHSMTWSLWCVGKGLSLLLANQNQIVRITPDVSDANEASEVTVLVDGLKNAVALDVHLEQELLFWSDITLNTINVAYLNGTNSHVLISTDISSPGMWFFLLFTTNIVCRRVLVFTKFSLKYSLFVYLSFVNKHQWLIANVYIWNLKLIICWSIDVIVISKLMLSRKILKLLRQKFYSVITVKSVDVHLQQGLMCVEIFFNVF